MSEETPGNKVESRCVMMMSISMKSAILPKVGWNELRSYMMRNYCSHFLGICALMRYHDCVERRIVPNIP